VVSVSVRTGVSISLTMAACRRFRLYEYRARDQPGRRLGVSPGEDDRQSSHTGSDHSHGHLGHLPLQPSPDVPRLPLGSCRMGDLSLQLGSVRTPSRVRIVHESISNRS